jgi:hypothetical protein
MDNLLTLTNTIINSGAIVDDMGITYTLSIEEHEELDRELFKHANGSINGYEHKEVIEINLGGISYYIDYV